jgi:hypothetical protein
MKLVTGCDHPLILVAPIMTVAGKGLALAAIDAEKRSESVMFDFMNPSAARWRFSREQWNLRLDKARNIDVLRLSFVHRWNPSGTPAPFGAEA